MTEHDGSQLAEADAALLRRLPARAHLIARRLRRFHAGGWDINGLCLLQVEAAELGAGSQALGLAEAASPLARIAELAAGLVEREELPGLETGDEPKRWPRPSRSRYRNRNWSRSSSKPSSW